MNESSAVGSYVRIPEDWLLKYSPKEWIRAAMRELRIAEGAYKQQNARAGLAGARRAAGMALNAALVGVVKYEGGYKPDPTAPRSFETVALPAARKKNAPALRALVWVMAFFSALFFLGAILLLIHNINAAR